MNILFIKYFFVGFMLSKIPRVKGDHRNTSFFGLISSYSY